MPEERFICPDCGFESNGAGLCPTCDQNLEKRCICGSGKFMAECCGVANDASAEEKIDEELIKAEVTNEALKEKVEEDLEEIKEEEELENVEEVKEE